MTATTSSWQFFETRRPETGPSDVRDLKGLRSLVRTALYDLVTCAQEVTEFAEQDWAYRYDVLEMTRTQRSGKEVTNLIDELKQSQKSRADQVQREAALLSSTLSISNDVSQTVSSIRTQRLVVLLTVVSIGIAFWAGYLTLAASH